MDHAVEQCDQFSMNRIKRMFGI